MEGWQLDTAVILMSPLPVMAVDTLYDVSGTDDLQDRWTLVGNPSDFQGGGLIRVPCFGAPESKLSRQALFLDGTATVYQRSQF